MKLFVAIYDDYSLLPHFICHYRALGISTFYIAADKGVAAGVRDGVRAVSAVVRDDLDVIDSFQGGTKAVSQMRFEYTSENEWVLISDLDEFAVLESSLAATTTHAESEGANVVRGRMIDRVARDGGLPPIDGDTDIWSAFPHRCRLTKLLQGSADHKGVLVRGHLLPTMAHHEFALERLSTQQLEIHHFKWSATAEPRMRSAMAMAKAAGINWWQEYERVLHHLDLHGRIRWEDFGDDSGLGLPRTD